MPRYVLLGKLTDQGVQNIKDLPKRMRERQEQSKGEGILSSAFFTQGEYDVVIVAEVADEETAVRRVLEVSMLGNARWATMRAFTLDEMERIVASLPSQ